MRKPRGGGNPQEAATIDCEARESAIGGGEEARLWCKDRLNKGWLIVVSHFRSKLVL